MFRRKFCKHVISFLKEEDIETCRLQHAPHRKPWLISRFRYSIGIFVDLIRKKEVFGIIVSKSAEKPYVSYDQLDFMIAPILYAHAVDKAATRLEFCKE